MRILPGRFGDRAPRIVVIGLGYVGLPLAAALARAHRHATIIGFDIDSARIDQLRAGHDPSGETLLDDLTPVHFSDRDEDCTGADFYILAVPTPVDGRNCPDLSILLSASRRVGTWIDPARRPTIVIESTVYPGVTEDVCGPAIEAAGRARSRDFRLAYSPERINPGDRLHRVDTIPKVIAGEDREVLEQLDWLYGTMTSGGVVPATSIRVAEAAKAIENAQRDINIALMNEVAQILALQRLSIWEVLDVARSKWNFLPFEPGLVGGHCIGVDPYYLSHHAQALGHDPQVILAGRGINDRMGEWIADRIHETLGAPAQRLLQLGLTFKEDISDVRNSRSFDIIRRLEWLGHVVEVHDPRAGPRQDILPRRQFDGLIVAVAHREFREMRAEDIVALLKPGGLVADIKAIWRNLELPTGFKRWSL